jgi:hypothetical protein
MPEFHIAGMDSYISSYQFTNPAPLSADFYENSHMSDPLLAPRTAADMNVI